MRVIAFRHIPFEGLGLIASVLERRNIEYQYADLFVEGAQPPKLHPGDALIFMGGPMSANDDLSYIRQEIGIIQSAAERGHAMLGVCLGAQIIAKALGGRVYRNPVKEIGWFPVEWTQAAGADPLFGGLRSAETIFHWHSETFDLPPGGEWLAYSEACRHQAFRLGRAIYGMQFHLEVTPAMIEGWCAEDANCGDVRELASPIDPNYNAVRLAGLADLVFGRWCDLTGKS